jgi:hypothetical protein
VMHVVLNRASAIQHPDLSPVLQVKLMDGSLEYVAVAGSVQKGRLLVVSDSSVFINAMLRYSGNRMFANGLAHYSTEDDTWGARGGTLYMVAGNFEQLGSLNPDDARTQVRTLARSAIELQQSMNREGVPPMAAYVLAVVVASILVLIFARRTGRAFRQHIPRYARAISLLSQGGLAGHAAVLSAPTTPPALALLEWTRVLTEKIKLTLGVDEYTPRDRWWPLLENRNLLSTDELISLRALLLRGSEVETRLLSGQLQKRIASTRDVESARDAVVALLATLERRSQLP